MLPANIEEITSTHIESLVAEKVTEHKTLEYKEKLPEGTDGAKKEFLADVCSFANSSGGYIIYGIRDQRDNNGKPTGIPEEIAVIPSLNLPTELARLEA